MANEESNNAKLIFLSIQFNIITRKKRRACLRFIMEKMNYFSYFRMFLLIFLYLWCFYDLELKGGLMRDWQRIRKKCLKNLESLKSRRKFFYPDKSSPKVFTGKKSLRCNFSIYQSLQLEFDYSSRNQLRQILEIS